MANILITGGSGLIGRALTHDLHRQGHAVRWLSRTSGITDGVQRHAWDPAAEKIDPRALEGADHIVHLSGADITGRRWTAARMREHHASRGGAARLLFRAAKENGMRPGSFISASGIGYYGAVTSDHIFSEGDGPGTDAIGRLTRDWEDAADEWSPICRVVKLRTPMVLAPNGGALKRLSLPFRLGLGAAFGNGKQWLPWVHINDLVATYSKVISDERMSGPYNVVADEQPMNMDFMRAVARAMHRPFFLPNVPAFALRLALGEMSSVVLEGSRASGARLAAAGSVLRYPALAPALQHALSRPAHQGGTFPR